MLLRLRVQLPLIVFIPAAAIEEWASDTFNYGDVEVAVFPPYRCLLEPGDLYGKNALPLSRQPYRLLTADPQPHDLQASFQDGPVVAANALRLDLRHESFDRERGHENVALAFGALNEWLDRLRLITWASMLTPIRVSVSSRWLLQYLNDDGSPAAPEKGDAFGAPHELVAMNVTPSVWRRIRMTPEVDRKAATAAHLLLDARSLSQHIGASIVLAYTALETRIESALDVLAKLHGVDDSLWTWINERRDLRARPSTEEQWDILLTTLGARSLKTEPRLWNGFKSLAKARNSFVHDGVAVVAQSPVDDTKAFELVSLACEIVDWLDEQLPEENRKPAVETIENFKHTFTI
jgi:hypothetical protein